MSARTVYLQETGTRRLVGGLTVQADGTCMASVSPCRGSAHSCTLPTVGDALAFALQRLADYGIAPERVADVWMPERGTV